MKSLTEYRLSTGIITRRLNVPVSMEIEPDEGCAFIEGDFNDERFKVVDGVPVPIDPPPNGMGVSSDPWQQLRANRNMLLSASDWTQLPDAPVDRSAWAEYRQALRDLPDQTTDPLNPVWPTPPA